MIKRLKETFAEDSIAVTASSGTAAQLIFGQTLHSWACVGLARQSKYQLLCRVQSDRNALERWEKVKTLIVDEVSMIDARLFDSLEYIGRNVTLIIHLEAYR